jgi:ketosteroid isomerase-like protein
MSTATEILKQFFAAINRNDMHALVGNLDPEIVRIEPEGFPTAGTYRGVPEVQEHVVVYLHARVRLKDSTEWISGRFADGFVFRSGQIVEYRSFGERTQALEWLESPNAAAPDG